MLAYPPYLRAALKLTVHQHHYSPVQIDLHRITTSLIKMSKSWRGVNPTPSAPVLTYRNDTDIELAPAVRAAVHSTDCRAPTYI